jgi:hypothetical protein
MTVEYERYRATCDRDGCDAMAWWTATRNETGGPDAPRILYRVDCLCARANTRDQGTKQQPDAVESVTAPRPIPEYFTRLLGRRAS